MLFHPAAYSSGNDFTEDELVPQKWGKSLGRFKVATSNGGHNVPTPSGLDTVYEVYNFSLSLDHHGEVARRAYKVGSRGEQCVVICCDLIRARVANGGFGGGQGYEAGTYQEVAWYEGEPKDVLPTLEVEFGQWLVQKMQEAFAEVSSGVKAEVR